MIKPDVQTYFTEKLDQIEKQYDAAERTENWNFIRNCLTSHQTGTGQSLAIDLGAGMGHYSAKLVDEFNMRVTAVEPVKAMIQRGKQKFPDARIEWINAAMPELNRNLFWHEAAYDFALMAGSWHYMDKGQRSLTLLSLSWLMRSGSHLAILYPYPCSREHQHCISEQETLATIQEKDNLWDVARVETLPYPIQQNQEAKTNSPSILAFDLISK